MLIENEQHGEHVVYGGGTVRPPVGSLRLPHPQNQITDIFPCRGVPAVTDDSQKSPPAKQIKCVGTSALGTAVRSDHREQEIVCPSPAERGENGTPLGNQSSP